MAEVNQPPLPEEVPWPDKTRQWWRSLPDTPGADSWSASDWEFLMTTALVHADVWGNQNFDRLPELRVREEEMGITPSARRKLGIGGVQAPVEEKQPENPLNAIAEERRLKLHVTHSPRKTGT